MDNGKKYRTLTDKYYFAAYLNMARHNTYLILADINTRLGFEKVPPDDAMIMDMPIIKKLKVGGAAGAAVIVPTDIQLMIIKELHGHFAFLKPMLFAFKKPKGEATEEEIQKMEYAPNDYYNFFKIFADTLNNLRNEYTHVAPQPFDLPADLLNGLRVTFDAGVRKAKARFNFDPKEIEHLVRQGKGGKEKPTFKYKFQEKGSTSLSIYGITFFICLLLERKYVTLFTQKIQGIKGTHTRIFKATYEVFAVHSVNLPKARYTSDSGDGALLLDMLNELKKCPGILFPQLQPAHQDAFRVSIEGLPGMDEDGDSGFVLLKRHEDRFTYLAMRFIDEVKWFQHLHFPVDLGNYHYHLYDKTVDGVPRIGSLWKKMIGYGRLPDYQHDFLNKKLPATWLELWNNHEQKAETSTIPYMPRTMPHYHLPDDNIAMKIGAVSVTWPQVNIAGNDKSKNKPGIKSQPDLLISKYELFAFIFYGLLLGAGHKELEDKLINFVHKRRQLYRNIQEGKITPISLPPDTPKPNADDKEHPKYNKRKAELNQKLAANGFTFTADDLTDEIKCYLMGVVTESFEEKAKYRLIDLVKETENLQEKIKRQLSEKRKLGSKKDIEIKAGILATYLAKDIMLFQPALKTEDAKAQGKATTTLYRVLQAKLALYGANVDTLERTFTECGLLAGINPHPFLDKVVKLKNKNIVDFYTAYLSARKQYLLKCQNDKKYDSYQWLKNNQARSKKQPDFGKQLAGKMLELPVIIPRGFFTEGIKKELLALNNESLNNTITNARTPNASFMFMAYLKDHQGDDMQEFYKWERVYKIFNNYHDARSKTNKRDTLAAVPLTEEERKGQIKELNEWVNNQKSDEDFFKYKRRFDVFESNEKQIRQIKVQDIAISLMCDNLLRSINKNLINTTGKFYLKDISPVGEKGILDMPMNNFGRVFSYSCISPDPADTASISGNTRISQDDLKVKNIGDFNKFIKDRRLNNLLAYMQKSEIKRQELEKELERYDLIRADIFKTIHEFESMILTKFPGIDGTKFEIIIDQYQQISGLPNARKEQIKQIRHAFSHNQYPNPSHFLDDESIETVGSGNTRYYVDYFLEFVKTNLLKVS